MRFAAHTLAGAALLAFAAASAATADTYTYTKLLDFNATSGI